MQTINENSTSIISCFDSLPDELLLKIFFILAELLKHNELSAIKLGLSTLRHLALVNQRFRQLSSNLTIGIITYHKNKKWIPGYDRTPPSIYHLLSQHTSFLLKNKTYTLKGEKAATAESKNLFYFAVGMRGQEQQERIKKCVEYFFYKIAHFLANISEYCRAFGPDFFTLELNNLLYFLSKENNFDLLKKNIITFDLIFEFMKKFDLSLYKNIMDLTITKSFLLYLDRHSKVAEKQPKIIQNITQHLQVLKDKNEKQPEKYIASIKIFFHTLDPAPFPPLPQENYLPFTPPRVEQSFCSIQ